MEVDEETRSFFDRVLAETTAIKRAVDDDRSNTAGEIRDLRNEMLTNFDALYKRDEERQTEYQAIKAALSRVERSLLEAADLETRVAQLETAARGQHDA